MTKPLTSYDILNVSPSATQEEVNAAYRKLVKEWHPDRHIGQHNATVSHDFTLLQEAYDRIKTPQSRARYNAKLKAAGYQIMTRQNAARNDNAPLQSLFKALESLFTPHKKD